MSRVAVSYTHLDVYKRQDMEKLDFEWCLRQVLKLAV